METAARQEVRAAHANTSVLPGCLCQVQQLIRGHGRRYVDMIVTQGVIDTFRTRSLVNSTVRRFLEDKQFLEVCIALTRFHSPHTVLQ